MDMTTNSTVKVSVSRSDLNTICISHLCPVVLQESLGMFTLLGSLLNIFQIQGMHIKKVRCMSFERPRAINFGSHEHMIFIGLLVFVEVVYLANKRPDKLRTTSCNNH